MHRHCGPDRRMTGVVFFDLDGTLTDPRLGIVRSIRYALDRLGVDCPDEQALTWCIGPPLLESFRTLVGDSLAPDAVRLYRERFGDVGWQENEPYRGIRETLEELRASGFGLYVATSKPGVFAERIIEHFGLATYFTQVFASELDGTRSDKGDLLRFALEQVGATGRATMVGDRMHDVIGAKRNQMRSIGVTYGYGGRDELVQAGADALADSPDAILAHFA
jgi:phosphoglycolate phosphatase